MTIRVPVAARAAVFALFSLPGCETIFPGFSLIAPDPPPPMPAVIDASEKLKADPPSDPWITGLLEDRENISVNLVRVKDRVEPHLHEGSDETIYVLEGGGDLLIEREWQPIHAGMLIHIPRDVPHAFINKTPGGTVALSMFTPALLSGDRVAVPFDPERPQ